jgi:hypothetical protein
VARKNETETDITRIRAELAWLAERGAAVARQLEQLLEVSAAVAPADDTAGPVSHRRPRNRGHLRVVKLILIGGGAAAAGRRIAAILMTAGTATVATAAVTLPLIVRAPAIVDGPGVPPAIPAAPPVRHHGRRALRAVPRRSIAPQPRPSGAPSSSPLAATSPAPAPSATPAPTAAPATYPPPSALPPPLCIGLALARVCLPLHATE